ncbi:MAG: hypothetical protein H6741_10210 [Alphaproteobacteria bacterium]|nr:hypothetical protein [Alphaproteobacteria bacterium]
MELLLPFMFFGMVVLVLGLSKHQADGRRRAWAAIAERLQLEMSPGGNFSYPSLQGRYRGLEVVVDVELRGGKNKVPYTRMRANVMPHVSYDVALYPQGFLQGVARLFGMQDIEVDDPDFDDHVVVQAKDVEAVRQLLSSARLRRTLVEVFREYHQARIDDGEAWLIRRGFTQEPALLTRDLDQLVDLCATLRAAANGEEALEPAIAQALKERRELSTEDWLTRNTHSPEPRVLHVDADGVPLDEAGPESPEPALLPPAPPPAVAPPPPVAPPLLARDEAVKPPERLLAHRPGPSVLQPAMPPVSPVSSTSRESEPAQASPRTARGVDLAALTRLADRDLGGRELDAAVEAVTGGLLSVAEQEIREVRRSSAFDGNEAYRAGQMAVVRVEGWPELAFRFRKDDPAGAALKRGGSLSAEGVVVGWERLYRRLVVEVSLVG